MMGLTDEAHLETVVVENDDNEEEVYDDGDDSSVPWVNPGTPPEAFGYPKYPDYPPEKEPAVVELQARSQHLTMELQARSQHLTMCCSSAAFLLRRVLNTPFSTSKTNILGHLMFYSFSI